MKKRSNLIRWLIVIPLCFSMVIFCDEAADAFSKIVLTYYEVPEFSLQVLSALFGAVVIGIPLFMVLEVAVWLERVIFLKRYCAKLQKEEQTHAAAKRRSKRFIHFSASAQPRQALARYERNKNIDKQQIKTINRY